MQAHFFIWRVLVAATLLLEIEMKVVAFERSMQGTGASRRLRNAGKTPGIIYGGEAAPN